MTWFLFVLAAAAAFALYRIVKSLRKLREPQDDWDARLIKKLRASGADPFQPRDVDFFFALPSETATEALAHTLRSEGYAVDLRRIEASDEYPWSLHAVRAMQLSVPDMHARSRHLQTLARAQGGRYDGWATAGLQRR